MEEAKREEKAATKSPTSGVSDDDEEEQWNQSVKGLSEEEKAASALLHNIKSKGKNSVGTSQEYFFMLRREIHFNLFALSLSF